MFDDSKSSGEVQAIQMQLCRELPGCLIWVQHSRLVQVLTTVRDVHESSRAFLMHLLNWQVIAATAVLGSAAHKIGRASACSALAGTDQYSGSVVL